ncbi:MAG: FG-GAP repeat protein, partial [Planctomycetota bacterium]
MGQFRSNPLTQISTIIVISLGFIQSITNAQELNATDAATGDQFGRSGSLSGNIGLIGAVLDNDNGSGSGSAYIFRNLDMAGGMINESVKLLASDGAAGDEFSRSTSLSGNVGLIGSVGDDDNGASAGSAYVFRNLDTASGTVNESVKLLASDGAASDQFGQTVGLFGNIGLIGAVGDDDNGFGSGSAYIYRNLDSLSGTINESAKLLASDGSILDEFGYSVGISGNIGLIGARLDDDNGSASGSAYVFRNLDTANGTINESVKLVPSDGAPNDQFGISVSLSSNIGLIGSQFDNENGTSSGSAYVFRNLDTANGTINESVKLVPSDGAPSDFFGFSTSLSGSNGLVSARGNDDNGSNSGSAYVFVNLDTASGTINELIKLFATDGAADDQFGYSVSLDGDRFTIGALRGDGNEPDSGSAFLGTVSSLTLLDFGN